VEDAVNTLLEIDYPAVDLLVVDDRSTDSTGAILDRLSARDERVNVVHIAELPAGWLGKNHALQFGSERAAGEYLLFTDADIMFESSMLRRSVFYAQSEGIDHLTAAPDTRVPGFFLNSFVATFTIFFSAYFRPWKASDPRSKCFVGIGAFNLVRRDVYEAIDGHRPIAMRPDDDVKLGKLIKMNGYRQQFVLGLDTLTVPWYGSIGELIVGLEKNAFAATDYRLSLVIFGTSVMLIANVWPFLGVFATGGWTRWLNLTTSLILISCCWNSARNLKQSGLCGLGFPVAVLMFIYIQWRSTLLVLTRRGIRWRDTFYPIDELRANRI
jgi:cellulose synthase/poly-beta-1,6-N-acetylglucosamine synthase-like glycosyltransferase